MSAFDPKRTSVKWRTTAGTAARNKRRYSRLNVVTTKATLANLANTCLHEIRLGAQNRLFEKPVHISRGALFGARSLGTIDADNGIAAIP
jgi:hypothetical protein